MNREANSILEKNPALAWREIDEETVIISPGESVMHELNDTGSFVWKNIDGRHSASDLAAMLVEGYDVTTEVALADTEGLLAELIRRKLVLPVGAATGGTPR
jgi:hypothetical protein